MVASWLMRSSPDRGILEPWPGTLSGGVELLHETETGISSGSCEPVGSKASLFLEL